MARRVFHRVCCDIESGIIHVLADGTDAKPCEIPFHMVTCHFRWFQWGTGHKSQVVSTAAVGAQLLP